MDPVAERAEVLVEALPYIRTFYGKTIVIKYGGAAMTEPSLKAMVAQDIVLLRYIGVKPVIVHGGGKEITDIMRKLGREPVFVNGLRVTDRETAEIAEMVLTGKINKDIVTLVNRAGGKALGLSGKDGNLVRARRKPPEAKRAGAHGPGEPGVDLGYVGDVEGINTEIIDVVCREGFIPVVSPIACDETGATLNMNADHLAGHLAGAMGAHKLVVLTDVEGIMDDPGNPASLVAQLSVDQARQMISTGKVDSGMIPKVDACITALVSGVPRTHIIDGRRPHSLLLEMFTDRGIGTMIANGRDVHAHTPGADGCIAGGAHEEGEA